MGSAVLNYLAHGGLADPILVFMSAEFVLISWRRAWRVETMVGLVFALAPGLCLALALRAALMGAPWPLVGICLAASLPFHLADIRRRRF